MAIGIGKLGKLDRPGLLTVLVVGELGHRPIGANLVRQLALCVITHLRHTVGVMGLWLGPSADTVGCGIDVGNGPDQTSVSVVFRLLDSA